MKPEDIARLHAEHWVRGSGPISPAEGGCILTAIEERRPRSFIELGTSSGLSTGLIAHMLHDNGGQRLVSVDVSERYYRDDSLASGFLVPKVYSGNRVSVELRSPMTSIDVPSWGETFDMGFVDGHHGHPWPVIDTLCLLPSLSRSAILFHHDLNLYKNQRKPVGIGPKYLFDQFPDSHRERYAASDGNLYSVSLDLPIEKIEAIAVDAFAIPWTTLRRKRDGTLDNFRAVLVRHYSPRLVAAFDKYRERFSLPPKPEPPTT